MSDEQAGQYQSKRERQKARRAQRQEKERAAAARARRTRLGIFALVGLLVVAVIGFGVQRFLAERAAERELIEEAQANLDEFGCTEDREMEAQGAGHFEGPELADNPPEVAYAHLPTTSGRHIGTWAATGVYDQYIDERLTTHNLEHGYVVIWYDEDADPEQVAELEEFAQERIDDGDSELVVAPYNQPLEDDANFAYVSWERRQLCEEFHEGVALNFINEHMNDQRAPEAAVGPHLPGEEDAGLVPGEDEVLFPPLNEESTDARGVDPESFGAEEGGEDS